MDEKIDLKLYSPNSFSELEHIWKRLEKGNDMTPFQSYDWYKGLNDLYKKERVKRIFRKWEYIVAFRFNEPVLIAPIQIVNIGMQIKGIGLRRGFYLIGRSGYTDYANFIYKRFDKNAFEEVLEYLIQRYGCNYFCFEKIIANTELSMYINNHYEVSKKECYCADLLLPESFEDYNSLLSKSSRQNIRTAINRQKRNEINLTHQLVYSINDNLVEELMRIRAIRLRGKKKKSRLKASIFGKAYAICHEWLSSIFDAKHDVMRTCAASWAFLVKDGEKIASFFWGIYDKEKKFYYVSLAGMDPEYGWYSPGISHFYLLLKEQYEKGDMVFKMVDFTRGGEHYKAALGCKKKESLIMAFEYNKNKLSGL